LRILFIMTTFSSSDPAFQTAYNELKNNSKNSCKNFAILKLAFPSDEIALLYEKNRESHNNSFIANLHCDSGFDMIVPENTFFIDPFHPKFIDMKVKAEMVYCDVTNETITPAAFYLYPRSSLSKTELMMANHVGIIDSGYRGSIIGAFRWLQYDETQSRYGVEAGNRLVQICHPTLCPIYVIISDESTLSRTVRAAGGFGSTGL
jgi:dUTP pyrophosphatase